MNTLSWLLYFAGAAENISVLLIFGSFITLSAVVVAKFVYGIEDKPQPKVRRYVIGAAIASAVACLLPSSKTVYMIAASEVGGRVAETAEAREMLDLLRTRVKDALAGSKK
jgi:hypothetical protein